MGIQAQIYRSPLVGACTFLLLILSLFLCMCFHHLRLYTVSGLWLGVYSCSVCFHEKKMPSFDECKHCARSWNIV